MALTGKTIGQLTYLQFPTNETLLPVEYIGDTYHITFSSITYNEGTYSQFLTEATNGVLTPGRFYLMTDYQTCYDQPNYDNFRYAITTGNYMTGDTEPILLLAVSTTGFSPTVYSTIYQQDQITYDITFNSTEITNSPAKGRITERIDNLNNRTDYDHRNILFKRYIGYSYYENQPLSGVVGISGITGTTGVLYGNTGTTFTSDFSTGSIVWVRNTNPSLYEILSVQSNSIALISGVTINEVNDSPYYFAINDGIMSYYQPNIRANEVFEYTTFGDAIDSETAINNYVGNQADLFLEWGTGNFLLANNVFLNGAFLNNTIGNESYNNTFNDDCDNNQIGDSFYNNCTNDDFDGNIIGENFRDNYITANFNNNRIGSDFNNNILIGDSFYRNNIGNNFEDNTWTNGDYFQNNEIGNQFNQNSIYNDFYNNDIGNGYNGNNIYSEFYRNLIGGGYNGNTMYSQFYENNIDHVFAGNIIGDPTNYGSYYFSGNRIGNYFEGNTITNNLYGNDILNNFTDNTTSGEFYFNTVKNYFANNTILGVFAFNQIGNGFFNNNIEDGFGYGISQTQGNVIGNNFNNNNIGEYFYNNHIPDNFAYNTTFNYFQWNNLQTVVDSSHLYSCVLYSATTVNVFKNNGGDVKLSYFDSSDVLTVESINEVACVSFTIQSSDFTNGGAIYSNTTALGIDGTEGFENTAPDVNDMAEGYYGEGLQGVSLTQLTNAYNALGLSLTSSTGYIWNVSWGPGSTITNGLVKFGSYVSGGFFDIQTVDPTDPNWQTPGNNNGTSLVGTFKFPATFTIYLPLINKGGWC